MSKLDHEKHAEVAGAEDPTVVDGDKGAEEQGPTTHFDYAPPYPGVGGFGRAVTASERGFAKDFPHDDGVTVAPTYAVGEAPAQSDGTRQERTTLVGAGPALRARPTVQVRPTLAVNDPYDPNSRSHAQFARRGPLQGGSGGETEVRSRNRGDAPVGVGGTVALPPDASHDQLHRRRGGMTNSGNSVGATVDSHDDHHQAAATFDGQEAGAQYTYKPDETQEMTAGAGVDLRQQRASGNVGYTTTATVVDAEGDEHAHSTGVTAGGWAQMHHGAVDGVGGSVGFADSETNPHEQRRRSITLSGGVTVTASMPHSEVVGGTRVWVVDYDLQASADLSGSMQGGAQGGTTAGPSVGGGGSLHRSGRRVFTDHAAALDFYHSGLEEVATATGSITEASVGVGEQRGASSERHASLGVQGRNDIVAVGASIQFGPRHEYRVEHIDEHNWRITIGAGEDVQRSETLGASVIALGFTQDHRRMNDQVYLIDTSNARGNGQAALDRFFATHELDGVQTGNGVTLETRIGHDTHSSGTTLSAGPLSVGSTGSVERQDIHGRGQGHRVEHEGSEANNAALVGGAYAAETTTVASNRDRYDITSQIHASSGNDNQAMLAAATGTRADQGDGHTASGFWTVTSHLSKAQIAELCSRLSGPEGASYVGRYTGRGDVAALAAVLRHNNHEQQERAISEFVSSGGPEASQWLRDTAGVGAAPYDVALEGDDNFLGATRAQQLDASIHTWRQTMTAEHAGSIAADAGAELVKMQHRLTAIRARDHYTDLPPELRAQLVVRYEQWIEELRTVVGRAETLQAPPQREGAKPAAATHAGDTEQRAEGARVTAQQWRDAVELSRRIHNDGRGIGLGLDEGTTPRAMLPQEEPHYRELDRLYGEACHEMSRAEMTLEHAERVRAEHQEGDAITLFDKAAQQFADAKALFEAQESRYQAIRGRAAADHQLPNALWDGYNG